MEVSQIEVFNALKNKLGEKEAELLIEYVRTEDKESKSQSATKEDLAKLESSLTAKIYIANFVQFAAMVATLVALAKLL